MKNLFIQLWKLGKATIPSEQDPGSEYSCAGRLLSSLSLVVIIMSLGIWITLFLLLKDRLFSVTLSGTILTNLTCLTFFGGLVIAIFAGALAGNFFRRGFWKLLTRRRKQ